MQISCASVGRGRIFLFERKRNMEPIDYILIGVIVISIALITVHLIRRKKQGKGGCGCGCSSCPSAGACPSAKAAHGEEKTKEEIKNE